MNIDMVLTIHIAIITKLNVANTYMFKAKYIFANTNCR